METYYNKRKNNTVDEAVLYYNNYCKKYNRRPTEYEMGPFFPLFMKRDLHSLRETRIFTALSGDNEAEILDVFMDSAPAFDSYEDFICFAEAQNKWCSIDQASLFLELNKVADYLRKKGLWRKGQSEYYEIVVTKELDRKKHRSLRVLSVDALEEDARAFIEDARKLTDQGDLINVDAILQVSVSANYNLYNELKRRYPEMCEAMKTLMRDEMMEAQKKGVLETLFGLVKDGILSVSDAAKRANMNVADFEKAYKMFLL